MRTRAKALRGRILREQLAGAGQRRGALHALERGDIGDGGIGAHALVEAAFLREVADALAHLSDGFAEDGDGALVRRQDAQHHAQRGRLAGAVGPEEAQDGAARQGEAEIVDRREIAEALGDVGEFDDGIGRRIQIRWRGAARRIESELTPSSLRRA